MKKKISLVCIGLCVVIFLSVVRAGETLLYFILMGEVPGTDYMLPPLAMFVLWGALGLGLFYLTPLGRRSQRKLHSFSQHLPRRRFTQI